MLNRNTDNNGHAVRDQIECYCETCKVLRSQIVSSIGAKGQVTRATCPGCGNRNRYKKADPEKDVSSSDQTRAPRTYHVSQNFEKGEMVLHTVFGIGEVVNVIDSRKIEVLFQDRLRLLVQGMASSSEVRRGI